jgi:hypothetical protein
MNWLSLFGMGSLAFGKSARFFAAQAMKHVDVTHWKALQMLP